VQRPRGVGADVLDLHLFALAHVDVAKCLGLRQNALHLLGQPGLAQPEIDKARMRDLGGTDRGRQLEVLDQRLCDLDRGHARIAGQLHTDRRGIVAHILLLGALYRDILGQVEFGEVRALLGALETLGNRLFQFNIDHRAHFISIQFLATATSTLRRTSNV